MIRFVKATGNKKADKAIREAAAAVGWKRLTEAEEAELNRLIKDGEKPRKPAKAAKGRRAAAIPVKAELEPETSDKDLAEEAPRQKHTKRLGGRWLTGFNRRHTIEPLRLGIKGSYKAESEGVFRPDSQAKIEEHRARNFTKVAGKHLTADGLVSRAGFRKIMADTDTLLLDVELIQELAEQVLRGQMATIFRNCVIDRSATHAEMAAKYGITEPEVGGLIEEANKKLTAAWERRKLAPTPDDVPAPARDEAEAWGERLLNEKVYVQPSLTEHAIQARADRFQRGYSKMAREIALVLAGHQPAVRPDPSIATREKIARLKALRLAKKPVK